MAYGIALRVEDAVLRPHEHHRLQSTTSGSREVLVERDLREPLECLDVPGARAGDDVVGQLGAGRLLVPARLLAPVADELLVERRLRSARRVLRCGQKRDESGVSASSPRTTSPSGASPNSNFVSARMIPRASACSSREAIERERRILGCLVALLSAKAGGTLLVDVLVVALDRLRRRREDRLGQPGRLLEATGKRHGRTRRPSRGSPSSRSRRGSHARRTRSGASRAAADHRATVVAEARADGWGRARGCARTRTPRVR